MFDDAQLYLQCTVGAATVTYGSGNRATCAGDGAPLLESITADAYPATVSFAVVADDSASWVLAVDSEFVVIEPDDGPLVLSTQMRAACTHVARAVTAQEEHDWTTVTRELDAAWRPGHHAGDRAFAESVPSPGSIEPGDTQTLSEQTDTLARRCGLRVSSE